MADEVRIQVDELERLRQIEAAAIEVLRRWDGTRTSATPMLRAIAGLRAALKDGAA